jgi:single-stranded-DNA-specific exonuclease
VAGIVAGRVRDAVCRPCVMLTPGIPAMKGSGRSIENYDLFAALNAHKHLFIRFGGHAMAAGLTMTEENIPLLREGLNKDFNLSEKDLINTLEIDHVLTLDDITLSLSEELARLAPFGKGNPEPLFAAYGLCIDNVRVLNEKNTLIFSFSGENGKRVKGIAFGLNEGFNEHTKKIDVVFTVETNVFNGISSVQMRIKSFINSY